MFNRRIATLILLWGIALGACWWYWQEPAGVSLPAASATVSAERWSLDLSGDWEEFSSLRQAWTAESQVNDSIKISRLDSKEIVLPSTTQFQVATKHFRIPGEWSARTMRLVLNGVDGQARIYLNGVDSAHLVGEIEGQGGTYVLEIPPSAFLYGQDNTLLIELNGGREQKDRIFGTSWPATGQITGQIVLEAVPGTTIDNPEVEVTWVGDAANLRIKAELQHRFLEKGPWTVELVLSDGSAEVAQKSLVIDGNDSVVQTFVAELDVPKARPWSIEDPFLYQLHMTVSNSQGDRDDLALPLGLRSVGLTDGEWHLNEEPLAVNGVALSPEMESRLRHQGNIQAWLLGQKEKGVNLVYFIGQYPDELWLQAADQVGIGIWAEWPGQLIPTQRLVDPQEYSELVNAGNRHPSLWAWTVGKGVDLTRPGGINYLNDAVQFVEPNLGFGVQSPYNQGVGGSSQLLWPDENQLQASWGQIVALEDSTEAPNPGWAEEEKVALIWAGVLILVIAMNVRSGSWGYKEIGERKPKRRLRIAWFWNGMALLARELTLAGLITSAIFQASPGWGAWFEEPWPGLAVLQSQSPWLIWITLGLTLVLLRLLQLGIAAAHLPNKPHPLGLAYWLERRYHWIVLVGLLWALRPLGIPVFAALAGYVALSSLFLLVRLRDVHRVRGRYAPFLAIPGIITGALIGWLLLRWPDLVYIWHLL